MMHRPQRPPTPAPARPDGVQLRAQRSPRLIALGVLLVVLGGIAAASLYAANTHHRSVVAMATDVTRGQVIGRESLTVVEVPETLATEALDGERIDELVGQHALTDLPAGAFPLPGHVGADPLPDGQGLVGLKLTPGRLPATEVVPGTELLVVSLAETDTTAVEATAASSPVFLDDGVTVALDIRVADADAATVARLAATDLVAVVVTGVA